MTSRGLRSNQEPAVVATALSRRFQGKPALDRLDFAVRAAEVVRVEGANGAGKTTLLRVLAGVIRPSAGRAWVGGWEVVRDALDARERITYLPVQDALHDELTPAENLRFALAWSGRSSDPRAVEAALVEVGFPPGPQRPCRRYSTGQRKRVALARTLLLASDVLLLDEPYGHLDQDGRALVSALVGRWRDQGRTVIYTAPAGSDDPTDRVLLLAAGRLAGDERVPG